MKKIIIWLITLSSSFLITVSAQSPLPLIDTYGFAQPSWHGNDHFVMVGEYDQLTVSMAKAPWEAFTLNLEPTAPVEDPVLTFKARASSELALRMDVYASPEARRPESSTTFTIPAGEGYEQFVLRLPVVHTFIQPDQSGANTADMDQPYVLLYPKPGEYHQGELAIKDMYLGSAARAEEMASEVDINVFPNPARNRVNIDMPAETFERMLLHDLSGREVYEKQVTHAPSGIEFLDIRGMEKGMYILRLIGPYQQKTAKISIQ